MPEFGLFTIDTAARTAAGYLLPWGVKSKGTSSSNTAPITFPAGAVRVPRDPAAITLNDEHGRFDNIARGVALRPDEAGIHATFSFFDTDEADDWLKAHANTPVYFSAEIADMTRAPGDIGAGRLAGAAVTTSPAFDGTGVALFSLIGVEAPAQLEDPDEDDDDNPDIVPGSDEDTDDATAPADPVPDDPAETEGEDMGDAVVPASGNFSRKAEPLRLSKAGFFSALDRYRSTADGSALAPYLEGTRFAVGADNAGLFALSDIAYDGAGGAAAVAGFPNDWLGELWDGNPERRIVPLFSPGVLKGIAINAWVWNVKPTMATWAGNKSNVPSNAPTVAPKQFFAQRYAGGHDLAREYYDFNQTEFIDSYVEAMVESYGTLSDSKAATDVLAGATAFVPGTPGTVGKGLSAIVDGALAVVNANATPSFAIVAPDIYREVLLTPSNLAAEYLSITAGLSDGAVEGFKVVPYAGYAAGTVVVGAREAVKAWELPGVPIRVSAPDLVKGGVDEAFFGYIAVGVTYPKAVVKATVAAELEAPAAAK
jgi:hypothetical protein